MTVLIPPVARRPYKVRTTAAWVLSAGLSAARSAIIFTHTARRPPLPARRAPTHPYMSVPDLSADPDTRQAVYYSHHPPPIHTSLTAEEGGAAGKHVMDRRKKIKPFSD